MQRILHFEIATAIKDRPKVFQAITLVLFAFSLTIIVVGSIVRLSVKNTEQTGKASKVNSYTAFISSFQPIRGLQK
jgi:hypothetical protein